MIRIYLTNLGKYNEGELIGEWVELPCRDDDLQEVMGRIGINEEYEEYFITDYESDIEGIKIEEYSNLDTLNDMAETLDSLDKYEIEVVEAMLSNGYTLEDAVNKKVDCMVYYHCNDMEDVAREFVEETGLLHDVPESLRNYFDYARYGEDMSYDADFIFTKNGNCVEVL